MIGGWSFVLTAYGVATIATGALTAWSFVALRRAERRADALRDR